MKTLFLFDLHTIRQNPFVFDSWTMEIFTTLHKFHGATTLWGDISPMVLLSKYDVGTALPFVATLPSTVRKELLQFATRWDDAAVELWCDLMRGEGKIAEIYFDILEWLVNRYNVDAFLYWGSNHTIKKFASAFGLRSMAMELGPTRSPFRETRYCDFAGVNGNAHISSVDLSKVTPMNIDAWRREGGICHETGSRGESCHTPLNTRYAEKIYRSPRPCALLVLQLDDDSNCLVHSGYSGMLEMVQSTVPRLVDANWSVFIKPHPAAAPERNPGRARWRNVTSHQKSRAFAEENYGEDAGVYWLDDVPTEEYISLLHKMDAVISVNSSVGFEAILMEKPVVALGQAPYNIRNCLPTLDQLLSGKVDREACATICRKTANLLLNYYLYDRSLLSSPPMLCAAIKRNIILERAAMQSTASLTETVLANPINLQDRIYEPEKIG